MKYSGLKKTLLSPVKTANKSVLHPRQVSRSKTKIFLFFGLKEKDPYISLYDKLCIFCVCVCNIKIHISRGSEGLI